MPYKGKQFLCVLESEGLCFPKMQVLPCNHRYDRYRRRLGLSKVIKP